MASSNLKGIIEELVNTDQRLSALEAKFDSFSNEQKATRFPELLLQQSQLLLLVLQFWR